MDTRLAASSNKKEKRERESNNGNWIQNPSDETESQAPEIGMNKRRKQETDPLKMGHVLEKVFGFLDAESIKAARQVNPLWSIEGAKSLITKYYVKIPRELQAGKSSTKKITMRKFKCFLAHKSKDFPIVPNIIVGAFCDVELWKSLGVLGYQVKSLKLKFMNDQAKLLHNLLNLLPNLNYLNCELMGLHKNKGAIFEAIISAMSKREKEGSSLAISRMVLEPLNEEELADMEKLADCKNVLIEELVLSYYCTRAPNIEAPIVKVLSKILSTSQNVLKKLTLYNCQLVLPLLDFPCMTALTHMDFRCVFVVRACKFSPSFRFSEKVPNLQEIFMAYPRDSTDFLQNLVDSTGTAPSVKRVNRRDGFMENDDVDALLKAFPNVEELQVHVNWISESKFRSLWTHGKNLKKLTLHIDWWPEMGNLIDWDYLFTGFNAKTLKKIKETPNLDLFTLEELEKLRVNPSISNLKELEHLEIRFSKATSTTVPKRMLTVAAKYEISQLPKNPKIFITFKNTSGFKAAFKEVSKLPNFIVKFKNYD